MGVGEKTGALRRLLAVFRRHKINLTRLESLPGGRKASERLIFVDCDGHVQDKRLARAIAQLEREGCRVKVLGSYPNTD